MNHLTKNNIKKKSVIFLHIPKAAGTTLHRIIEQQYEPTTIFTIDQEKSIEDFKKLSTAQRSEIKVLKGHMYFGLHNFLPQPSTYITILRDPIERVISHYYYILHHPDNELYKTVISQKMSLKEFVCSGISLETDNGQTRLLSTTGSIISYGKCSTEILESAKNNLRKYFAVVGFVERFEETLVLLKRTLVLKLHGYIKYNITENRPLKKDISKATLELIKKYNELDHDLYKYAEEIFKEVIHSQGFLFKVELKKLNILN